MKVVILANVVRLVGGGFLPGSVGFLVLLMPRAIPMILLCNGKKMSTTGLIYFIKHNIQSEHWLHFCLKIFSSLTTLIYC